MDMGYFELTPMQQYIWIRFPTLHLQRNIIRRLYYYRNITEEIQIVQGSISIMG
jgi:hypothetical protein